jgi:hypothetical protein
MLKEHDTVALTLDRPSEGLRRGDVGAVVHCHRDGRIVEVEFIDEVGQRKAIVAVPVDELMGLNGLSLSPARP